MKKQIILLILSLLLVACGATQAEPTNAPEPTAAPTDAPEPTAEPTELPEPTDEPTAAPEPTDEPTALPEPTEEPVAVAPTENLADGCVADFDESVDYFPEKSEITNATGFSVEYFNNYKVVTVGTPFAGAEQPVQYVLVQCGTPAPEGFADATTVEVPIESIVAMSTTYLPALELLGRADALVGVDTGLYITSEEVRGMLDAGEVAEIGSGAEVNVEVALDLDPDLIMASASGFSDYDAHPVLEEAGLPVALNADYLDLSPLGRAEWVDFVALFFNEEATSEAWFADIVMDYENLSALTADVETRPTVFANTPFDGTWYMPGGESYSAQLFADAGAQYLWSNDESTSTLYLDFETVFDQAADADYWVNVGLYPSLEAVASADERHTEFAAFQNGDVFNYDARTNANGGNDIFESGVVYPNLVLADLIKIFHPELVPDHTFVYYRPLE